MLRPNPSVRVARVRDNCCSDTRDRVDNCEDHERSARCGNGALDALGREALHMNAHECLEPGPLEVARVKHLREKEGMTDVR